MTPQPCRYCGALVARDEEGKLFATHPGNTAPWACLLSPSGRHLLPAAPSQPDHAEHWNRLRDQITRDAETEQELGDGYSEMGTEEAESRAAGHWGRAAALRDVLKAMDRMEGEQ
jgi:hypothetical protein